MRNTVEEEETGWIGDGEFGDDLSEQGSFNAEFHSGSELGWEAADLSDVDPELENGASKGTTSDVLKAEETGKVEGGEFDDAKEVTRMKRNDVEDKREQAPVSTHLPMIHPNRIPTTLNIHAARVNVHGASTMV